MAHVLLGIERNLKVPIKLLMGNHQDGQRKRPDARQCLNNSVDANHMDLVFAQPSGRPSEPDPQRALVRTSVRTQMQ